MSDDLSENMSWTSLSLLDVGFLEQCWRVVTMSSDLYKKVQPAVEPEFARKLYHCKAEVFLQLSGKQLIPGLLEMIESIKNSHPDQKFREMLLRDSDVVKEFSEKLEILIDFSEEWKDIFELVYNGDEFGGGVKLLGIPEVADGAFTEVRFHWDRPLIYTTSTLNEYFEDYEESQHPIARRLWDRGSSLQEKEVFIGLPGFFNHACAKCASF